MPGTPCDAGPLFPSVYCHIVHVGHWGGRRVGAGAQQGRRGLAVQVHQPGEQLLDGQRLGDLDLQHVAIMPTPPACRKIPLHG